MKQSDPILQFIPIGPNFMVDNLEELQKLNQVFTYIPEGFMHLDHLQLALKQAPSLENWRPTFNPIRLKLDDVIEPILPKDEED